MDFDQKAVIEWCRINRPELAKHIEQELTRGNVGLVNALCIGWQTAMWKVSSKPPK